MDKLKSINRKEKEIIAYTSLSEYRNYRINVFEDEWENMDWQEKRDYFMKELRNNPDYNPKESLEEYEENS